MLVKKIEKLNLLVMNVGKQNLSVIGEDVEAVGSG